MEMGFTLLTTLWAFAFVLTQAVPHQSEEMKGGESGVREKRNKRHR